MVKTRRAHPIQTLREQVTALNAAADRAQDDPAKEPVHRLRTSTRRIEAQLELLSLLPGLPDHAAPARKLRRLLKHLRRAAGAVRDLDVQRDLIKAQQPSPDTPADPPHAPHLRRAARNLRRHLKDQRAREAAHLRNLLRSKQAKLASATEDLLEALRPVEDLSLTSARLSQLTLGWYQQRISAASSSGEADDLHTVRKFAKLARYIAESGGAPLAKTFESLQQAGGAWHDLLTLADQSKKHLGSHSPLTRTFEHQCAAALDLYQQALHKGQIHLGKPSPAHRPAKSSLASK